MIGHLIQSILDRPDANMFLYCEGGQYVGLYDRRVGKWIDGHGPNDKLIDLVLRTDWITDDHS